MAEILQSHLSHPVLSFYRAQHWGQSWLVSLTTLLDSCALLIVGGEGLAAEQARLTYRMGLHLLKDLTDALGLAVDPQAPGRLTEADVPALIAALEASAIPLDDRAAQDGAAPPARPAVRGLSRAPVGLARDPVARMDPGCGRRGGAR